MDVDGIADGRARRGRRRHGAHREGRHPLRRLRVRAAALLARPTTRSSASRSRRRALARELGVIGLMNVQFAIKNEKVYVLEVNPRASRTVPFVSKAIGVPLAKLAAKVMIGQRLAELGLADGARGRAHRGQGSGLPLHQVPRRRRDPRPRDEVHRRSHGHRPRFPQGLRQVADRRRLAPAHLGQGLSLREESGQAGGAAGSQAAGRHGLLPRGHRGHGQAPAFARA